MLIFSNIVYVLNNDVDELSPTFIHTVNLAKANQADLTLLKILPDMPTVTFSKLTGIDENSVKDKILAQENAKLQHLVSSLDADLNVRAELKIGKKYIEIIHAILANNYDLVVKEVDDVDWLNHFFDSDDMNLLQKCPCPVWLMKKNEKPEYKHIVAAIDFDDELEINEYSYNDELNQKILELSISLSFSDFTTLHVVNAYDVPLAGFIRLWVDQPEKVERELFEAEYQKRRYKMNTLMKDLKKKIGAEPFDFLSPRTYIVKGLPGRELPKIAESLNADLVVMGTVARTGIAGVVIGNTAETVLSELKCSVLALKPKDFVSPVS